jgi:hypothetical protein
MAPCDWTCLNAKHSEPWLSLIFTGPGGVTSRYAHLPITYKCFRCELNRKKSKFERYGMVTTLTGPVMTDSIILPPKPGTRYWPFLYYPALFFATTRLPQSPLGVTSPKAIRIPEFPLLALTKSWSRPPAQRVLSAQPPTLPIRCAKRSHSGFLADSIARYWD